MWNGKLFGLVKHSFYESHDLVVLAMALVLHANREVLVPVAPPDDQNSPGPHKILLLEGRVVKLCPGLYAQRVHTDGNSRLETLLGRCPVLRLDVLLLQLALQLRQLLHLLLQLTQQHWVTGRTNSYVSCVIYLLEIMFLDGHIDS